MSEWQPISSAPKDETKILVYVEDTGVFECRLMASGIGVYSGWTNLSTGESDYFWPRSGKRITHWMPLPAPPTH